MLITEELLKFTVDACTNNFETSDYCLTSHILSLKVEVLSFEVLQENDKKCKDALQLVLEEQPDCKSITIDLD